MKYLMLCLMCVVMFVGCDTKPAVPDADKAQAAQTKKALAEADRQIGQRINS